MSHHTMYTILIVDDNPNNLFTLRTLLTENDDYLSKPIDYDVLIRLVSTWVE